MPSAPCLPLLLLLLLLLMLRCHAPACSPSVPITSSQPLRTTHYTTTIANHPNTVPITSEPTTSSCA
jgi:hypothetical protein